MGVMVLKPISASPFCVFSERSRDVNGTFSKLSEAGGWAEDMVDEEAAGISSGGGDDDEDDDESDMAARVALRNIADSNIAAERTLRPKISRIGICSCLSRKRHLDSPPP